MDDESRGGVCIGVSWLLGQGKAPGESHLLVAIAASLGNHSLGEGLRLGEDEIVVHEQE